METYSLNVCVCVRVCEFELPHTRDNLLLEAIYNPNKNPCASYVISPFKLLVRGVPDNPRAIEAIVIVLSWPPELGGKTLLL